MTDEAPERDTGGESFDDDALADALAAHMATYTSPISIITPAEAEAARTPPAEPVAEVPTYAPPVDEPPIYEVPVFDTPTYTAPSYTEPVYDGSAFVSSGYGQPVGESTIDAIERLEGELRRHGFTGETPIIPTAAEPEVAAPLYVTPEPAVEAYVAPESAAPTYVEPAPEPEFVAPTRVAPEPESGAYVTDEPTPTATPSPMPIPSPIPVDVASPPAPTAPPAPEWTSAPPPDLTQPPAPEVSAPAVEQPVPAEVVPESLTSALLRLPPPSGQQPAELPPWANAALTPAVVIPEPDPSLAPIGRTEFASMLRDSMGGAPPAFVPEATEPADLDENDDAVDETDRAPASAPGPAPEPVPTPVPEPAPTQATEYPLSAPIPTQRVTQNMPALVDEKPQNHPALMVETAGDEPTALDLRAGRAARLFWLWFATNSSVLSLALGAVLFTLGMSLRQAIVATLAGVALSFLPLGLGTLAGKWSGQPTMIVSRAIFGHAGNLLPAALAILTRIFWGGVLLWLLATSLADVLGNAGLSLGLSADIWAAIGLLVSAVVVGVVALFGYGFIVKLHLIISIVSGLLVVGVIAITYPSLDLDAALATGDGSWLLVLTGTVLVFSVIGLAWVHASSDLARYQRPASSGGASMLWATFGATLPAFLLIAWGAMLAASDPQLADGLATAPLLTLAGLLPSWYPVPLLLAAGLGLISGAVVTVYSGGFALKALGLKMPRYAASTVMTALAVVVAIAFVLLSLDTRGIVRDAVTTLAVPVAAWAGIFAAEMMIRTRRFHAPSLLSLGGIYPNVRIVNLSVFLGLTVIGLGLTSGTAPGFTWQGFLFPLFGVASDDLIANSDVGVLVVLVLALIITFATAIPSIRRQEADPVQGPRVGSLS